MPFIVTLILAIILWAIIHPKSLGQFFGAMAKVIGRIASGIEEGFKSDKEDK